MNNLLIRCVLVFLLILTLNVTYSQSNDKDCFGDYENCAIEAEGETLQALKVIDHTEEVKQREIKKFISKMRVCSDSYFSCTATKK